MTTVLATLLQHHLQRCGTSLSRIARQAGLPKQTLFHWTRGREPRWHARLGEHVSALSQALGMDTRASDALLVAAGCATAHRTTSPETPMTKRTTPRGWCCAGSRPQDYDMGLDPEVECDGLRAVGIASRTKRALGFGTFMQSCCARTFAGKRVRFTALVRSEQVTHWAGLWFRIDAVESGRTLGFDNMSERPITGTTDWTRHAVVLDVPEAGKGLAYGVLLSGPGRVWIAGVRVEVVTADVPTTNMASAFPMPELPTNLEFGA